MSPETVQRIREATRRALAGPRPLVARCSLVLVAAVACGGEEPATVPATAPATEPVPTEEPAPAHAPATQEAAPSVPTDEARDRPAEDGAGRARIQIDLGGNTIVPAGGMSQPDGWSLVELTLADGGPLRVDVRLAPDLAVDPSALWAELIAEANRGGGARQVSVRAMDEDQLVASATLPRATLTLAGRAVDLSGGRLSIGGVDLGPLAAGAQVELSAAGVRVDGERRGDLPD
jgi:hypothetical protein